MFRERIINYRSRKFLVYPSLTVFSFSAFYILVCLFFFLPIKALSQQEQFRFEHITIKDGLNNNQVYSIGQDKQGFMWFGTPSGLNRFDGYNVKIYSNIAHYGKSPIFEDDHGSLWMICEGSQIYRLDLATDKFKNYLSAGLTYQLYKDKEGEIWAATFGNGLARYVQAIDTFITYKNNIYDSTSISSDSVIVVFQDSKKNIWVGTRKGLNLFMQGKDKFKRWDKGPKRTVSAITEDKNGTIWLGTIREGVYAVDKSLKNFKYYHDPFTVFYIYVDSKNNLWLETNSGVSCFDRQKFKFVRSENYLKQYNNSEGASISQNPILESNDGRIWSIAQTRIAVFDTKMNDFEFLRNDPLNFNSINDNMFVQLFKDNADNLWFGTNSGGVNYLSNSAKSFIYFPKKFITSLYMDKTGILWIGTQNGIFEAVRNNEKIVYKKIKGINCSVNQISEDSLGNIWIVGSKGLIKIDKKTEKINFLYANEYPMTQLLIDNKGMIWIANWDWLLKYNPYKKTFSHFSKKNSKGTSQIFSFLYEDHYANIWAGPGELSVFNDDSLKPVNYTERPYLKNKDFKCIYEDSKNNMWFISSEKKLFMLDSSNKKLNDLTPSDGLINENILRIISDNNGIFWLLTTNGISKYNPSTGRVKNYSSKDVLVMPATSSYPYNPYCKGNSGEIYVGGNNGYVMFYPDSIKDNTYVPPVVLTSFKIFNKEVKLDTAISHKKALNLTHSENSISFEFAALNYTSPQKNQYAYKLEGFDKEWTYCGTRRNVSYTNLDHGSYVFRVKGSNNDGVWNKTGTSISLIITPPWWETKLAYILYALFITGIVYLACRSQIKRIRVKNEYEMSKFEAEKLEEVNELKSRFFTNISHEFRTPLTLILGPTEKIISRSKDNNNLKDAGIVKTNATRLLKLVNQLLDLSKLESGKLKLEATKNNIVLFVKGVALSFESLSEEKDITLKIEPDKEYIELYFDKEKMLKILSNILSNAFKFTPQNGKITIAIKENDKHVEIKVKDSGIGIPKEEIPKLFDRFFQVDSSFTKEYEGTGIGLALTKELIELHHGSISVESERDNPENSETSWTEVTIKLPLGKNHLKEEEIVEDHENKKEFNFDQQLRTHIETNKKLSDDANLKSIKEDKTIILIVEDNYDMREYIKESLKEDYLVEEAVNGEQGLRKAENIIPDLIISDVMMPKLDGNEMTKTLKNDERTSHIPVIILTAKSGQESKLEGLQTGADDYLTKPFDIRELKIRIENLIRIRKNLQQKYGKGESVHNVNGKKLRKIDEQFLNKVLKIIDKNISDEHFSIEDFSGEIGMSRTQLHRKLKALSGKSASRYLRSVRLNRAKKMIEEESGNISEIAYSIGFSSPAYFSRCFKEEFGYPPSDLIG